MTAFEAQAPIFEVRCDVPECEATFTPDSAFSRRHARQARLAAGDAGWDVPRRAARVRVPCTTSAPSTPAADPSALFPVCRARVRGAGRAPPLTPTILNGAPS